MAFKYKNSLLIISLILNVLFIAVALMYVIKHKESLTQKFVWSFNTETLIMFGDSHTANGNWNDLLGRCDVLKLGYSGFTSGQLEFTMKHKIIKRNASYCFIQCGGNDLNKKDYNPKQIMVNIGLMINYLKANDITPVLQSLFQRPDQQYNLTIDSLNADLKQLALSNNIDFIDVNKHLNMNNSIGEHVMPDKIHLNQQGYEIWGMVVKEYLRENGI